MSQVQRKRPVHSASDAAWLLTYADMITLLMALFLLLFSMSNIDPAKFEATTASISEHISGTQPAMPLNEVIKKIKEAIKQNNLEKSVLVTTDGAGVVIEFLSGFLFEIGRSDLNSEAKPILSVIVKLVAGQEYARYGIEIEGHTDDIPIVSERFPSNWELSSSRATSVTKLFLEQGINPKRLRAIGYGESQPKFPNRDEGGKAIAENQAANRRIVLRLYPQTFRTLSEDQKKDLDKQKKELERAASQKNSH